MKPAWVEATSSFWEERVRQDKVWAELLEAHRAATGVPDDAPTFSSEQAMFEFIGKNWQKAPLAAWLLLAYKLDKDRMDAGQPCGNAALYAKAKAAGGDATYLDARRSVIQRRKPS